jgi:hypothetical protein
MCKLHTSFTGMFLRRLTKVWRHRPQSSCRAPARHPCAKRFGRRPTPARRRSIPGPDTGYAGSASRRDITPLRVAASQARNDGWRLPSLHPTLNRRGLVSTALAGSGKMNQGVFRAPRHFERSREISRSHGGGTATRPRPPVIACILITRASHLTEHERSTIWTS